MKRHILLVSSLFPNSSFPELGVYTLNICSWLNKLCDLEVIAPVPYFPRSSCLQPFKHWHRFSLVPEREVISGITVYHPRYLVIPRISRNILGLSFFFGILGLMKKINKHRILEGVNAHYLYPDGMAAVLAAKILKIPVFLSALGSDVNINTRFPFVWSQTLWAIRNAAGLSCVSQNLKDKIVEAGVRGEKIKIIPNGVDQDKFTIIPSEAARKELGLRKETKIILFVGSFDKFCGSNESIKGIEYLIKAAAILRQDYAQELNLFLIGEGPLLPRMKKLARCAGVGDISFFTGQKPYSEIPLWIAASDVLCRPTLIDGMPNVVLEALACARPVVASNLGAMPQLINSENGILVEPRDAGGLAKALKAALERDWDKEKIRLSIKNFTWGNSAFSYFKEMEKVVAARRYTFSVLYHHRTRFQGASYAHIKGLIGGFEKLGGEVFVVSPYGINRDGLAKAQKNIFWASLWQMVSCHMPEIFFEIGELFHNICAYLSLANILKRHQIDFIYERYGLNTFAGVFAAHRYHIPIVLEVNHVSFVERTRKTVLKKIAKRIEEYIFKNADHLVVTSAVLKELILKHTSVPAGKITITPNAADEIIFDPDKYNPQEVRRLFGLAPDRIVIGFVGSFAHWHGLGLFLETIPMLLEEHKNIHFFFVGSGVKLQTTRNVLRSKGLLGQATFTDHLSYEKIPQAISALDIAVIPDSNSYGSPLKFFEYLAMAKAVVAPDLGPIREVAEDGINVVLFRRSDKLSMYSALTRLIQDRSLREMIARNSRRLILERHTWEHNARKILEIIQQIRQPEANNEARESNINTS